MTVTELISTINNILNLGANVEENMNGQPVCTALLTCCNLALEDLYRNYVACCRKTVVEAKDGFVDTKELKLCKVISLTDSRGCSAHFRYVDGGLLTQSDGKYNLIYAKLPSRLNFDSEIELPSPRLSSRIFVYAVIAQYLTLTGDYTAAQAWQDKLDAAISVAFADKAAGKMPSRRWLL